ncbi:MAG TPA: toll/interleukin-1 receptor domain-containing protein [Blastocatellia bacterium]|nr:toll/interleukin-1 receptor domain-containing protein [Blastocatellia bacterium]
MANEEHLAILKQGVKVWNKWRSERPEVRPDLSNANLQAANLFRANLHEADLCDANLDHANLSGANLTAAAVHRTNLIAADLSNADLKEAELNDANLISAKLDGAILTDAELVGATLTNARLRFTDARDADLTLADLSDATLRGANLCYAAFYATLFRRTQVADSDFTNARIESAVFADTDLSEVRGLESVRHRGPSEITVSTLYKSAGKIPEAFLRGCGVPDDFITFIPSLFSAEKAIQFYSCFISYSSKDQDFAERLHSDLQSKHIRVWFAPEDLKIGDRFPDRIEESIRLYDKLLLILSEDSIESSWVEREVRAALEKEESRKQPVLFPIRLDDAVMDCDKAWGGRY